MGIVVKAVALRKGVLCEAIEVTNALGNKAEYLTMGAAIKGIYVPDRKGKLENVVLEYADIADYEKNPANVNVVVGRTAGRIYKGRVTIAGHMHRLKPNQNGHTLHGGTEGIQTKRWYIVGIDEKKGSVKLACGCKNMEQGYPGNMCITVTYTWDDTNTLTIDYEAVSDETTLANLTNHAYFNLSGDAKHSIESHELNVKASSIAELDAESIPTGTFMNVGLQTPFDFRFTKKIGQDIDAANDQLKIGKGYDHPFALDQGKDAVTLYDETSGRHMTMSTDQRCVVIYTMNHPHPSTFTNGLKDIKRYGICLEAQQYPIGYREVFKEYSLLSKGDKYTQHTVYHFSVKY